MVSGFYFWLWEWLVRCSLKDAIRHPRYRCFDGELGCHKLPPEPHYGSVIMQFTMAVGVLVIVAAAIRSYRRERKHRH